MTTPFMNLIRRGVGILGPEVARFIGINGAMSMEAPVWLARGRYDVGRLGCYSYIGEDAVFLHTACVGRFCSIARRVTVGESEHPTGHLSTKPHGRFDGGHSIHAADLDFNKARTKIAQPVEDAIRGLRPHPEQFGLLSSRIIQIHPK